MKNNYNLESEERVEVVEAGEVNDDGSPVFLNDRSKNSSVVFDNKETVESSYSYLNLNPANVSKLSFNELQQQNSMIYGE